uniref:Family with sequence similarity 124 member B n=1 Tax=Saimiri boliviensis boliviensis TaxID=39432 RepID=A0A2K6UTW1_SAIBB|nr:protein FAM124B [Saimiri boliviensis boliviensis]
MDETQGPLALTVHLLANSGHGSLLQRTLDQLLDCICPEVRLFQVSERASPVKYCEKSHSKRSRFPGMSVLLFLPKSLGEDRLFRILDSLQHSPWQYYPTQDTRGRLCPYLLANQEFYSLDSQMPIWGVRQVHSGSEILRVTLYCSFDNYEDAIRLYEMILQREATLQKSNFCFFMLYATNSFALQLSLKQLPPGMSVDPKESSVLQFKVREIGQLVPLLPNPCIPISSTRWQTQDYDGNKILLQVQLNPELAVKSGTSGAGMLPLGSRLTSVSTNRTLEPRSQRSQVRRFQGHSLELPEPGGSPMSDSCGGASWKSPGRSFQASSPATGAYLPLSSHHLESRARKKVLNRENSFQKLEAETNVDTGFTIINSEPRQTYVGGFPRDLQTSQPPFCLPASSLGVSTSKNSSVLKERVCPLPLAGQRDLGTRKTVSKCLLHLHVQGEEKEDKEEFFI